MVYGAESRLLEFLRKEWRDKIMIPFKGATYLWVLGRESIMESVDTHDPVEDDSIEYFRMDENRAALYKRRCTAYDQKWKTTPCMDPDNGHILLI